MKTLARALLSFTLLSVAGAAGAQQPPSNRYDGLAKLPFEQNRPTAK